MATLLDRIDISSITTTLLPLPKGKKRGAGVGFCGGNPVASVEGAGYAAPPFQWVEGKPRAIAFQDVKKFMANGASESQLAGCWLTPKGDERAVVWTRTADEIAGIELHPQSWQKSVAMACGDGQQIGYGYPNFVKDSSKALVWGGTRDSMVILTGPDSSRDAMGHAVAEGVQVGYVGGSAFQHACLWRGSSDTYVDLHPGSKTYAGSEAWGVGDGQQVGAVWTENALSLAALWSGSADSYVNLSPDGFVRSRASRCARGFQVGWVSREARSMLIRAMIWNGRDDDYLDLQDFLTGPWNASWATDLLIEGDRLLVMGTAQQAVKNDRYEMDAGKVPVMWEMKLKIAEQPRVAASAPVLAVIEQRSEAAASDEQRVERVVVEFAQAVVDGDFDAARAHLAPWLQHQVSAEQLQRILQKELIDGVAPADFTTSGNDSALAELREHYAEYHHNDPSKTLATTDEFGHFGPPSLYIADEITASNFRQWMSAEFVPAEDDESGLDYCLRLWLIVVEADGAMVIGHLEPGE